MWLRDHHGSRILIRDGARQITASFDTALAGSDITAIWTPRSPRTNTYAQQWVRTLRHELLDRTIIWNEHQLERLLDDYVEHYNSHRPHRGLHQRTPNNNRDVVNIERRHPIRRHTTSDGLINEHRSAARRPHRPSSTTPTLSPDAPFIGSVPMVGGPPCIYTR